MNKYNFIFILLFFVSFTAFSAESVIIPRKHYGIDFSFKLVVINRALSDIKSEHSGVVSEVILEENGNFVFDSEIANLEYGVAYTAVHNGESFTVYFTQLPIVNLVVGPEIVDTPKVPGTIVISDTLGEVLETLMGVEYRGSSSQAYAKKSMEFKIWEDSTGTTGAKETPLGLNKDDAFNLQALYTEPSRINSKILYQLWSEMNTLHYSEDEPDAKNHVKMVYTELFLNDEYRGVYALGEKMNRSQLKLKKMTSSGEIRGQLLKGDSWGATTFSASTLSNPPVNGEKYWHGFDYKHPKDSINWDDIHEFITGVITKEEDDFKDLYKTQFDVQNAAEYFIFLNLIRATDNTGKNIFIARYTDDTPFFWVPWDLDGTLGYIWDRSQENITDDILRNGFFDKLILDCDQDSTSFSFILKTRWKELREEGTISVDYLHQLIDENYDYLTENGVYIRENLKWGTDDDYEFTEAIVNYSKNWIVERMAFLDTYFEELCGYTVALPTENKVEFKLYPNPATESIKLEFVEGQEITEVEIVNTSGQTVYRSNTLNTGQLTVDVSKFTSGLYFIKVSHEEGVGVKRFEVFR